MYMSPFAGSAEERLAALEAAEKEKRIQLVCERAARRISNQGIMRGFTAWQETYYEGVRQMQMLQAAGARLTRPLLTATFLYWREDLDAAEQARREEEQMGALGR